MSWSMTHIELLRKSQTNSHLEYCSCLPSGPNQTRYTLSTSSTQLPSSASVTSTVPADKSSTASSENKGQKYQHPHMLRSLQQNSNAAMPSTRKHFDSCLPFPPSRQHGNRRALVSCTKYHCSVVNSTRLQANQSRPQLLDGLFPRDLLGQCGEPMASVRKPRTRLSDWRDSQKVNDRNPTTWLLCHGNLTQVLVNMVHAATLARSQLTELGLHTQQPSHQPLRKS